MKQFINTSDIEGKYMPSDQYNITLGDQNPDLRTKLLDDII